MKIAPYGSWVSPISAAALAAESGGLGHYGYGIAVGEAVYFTRSDPADGGRVTLQRWDGTGEPLEMTPGHYVRSAINEYGGGAWAVAEDPGAGVWIVYSDWPSYDLHVIEPGGVSRLLAPGGLLRYGSLSIDVARHQVVAVREDHRGEGEAVNTVVALCLDGDNTDGGRVLQAGADFYANPVVSRDGRLAWVEWDFPNMPWDSTRMMVAPLDEPSQSVLVSSGGDESVCCPDWSPDGGLFYLSDINGFWNLTHWGGHWAEVICDMPFDFCLPRWQPNPAPFSVIDDRHVACAWLDDGWGRLGLLTLEDDAWRMTPVVLPGQPGGLTIDISGDGSTTCALVQHDDRPAELLRLRWADGQLTETSIVFADGGITLPVGFVSRPQAITYDGDFGPVHAWWYPPANPDFCAPDGELPPVQVWTHGGPTAFAAPVYDLAVQFWTTRGIGIVDVNYCGSGGYGRAYRDRLKGNWGIADVSDCASAVATLASRGLADATRASIRGGSAGGYTTLACLVFTDVFAAGISLYGIGDLETMVTDTHKYESRYLDTLVAPYPKGRQIYLARSPIHHLEGLNCPMLIMQGADDKVVPPSQAREMANAVKSKGLPVELIVFDGEGHGFRKAESIITAEQAALAFLGRVHCFTPAE